MVRCGVVGPEEWAGKLQGGGRGLVTLGEDLRSFRPDEHRGGLDVLVMTASAIDAAAADPERVYASLRRLLPDCLHVCVREPDDPRCDGWPDHDVYTWPDDAFRLFSRLQQSGSGNPTRGWWEDDEPRPVAAETVPPAATEVAATAPGGAVPPGSVAAPVRFTPAWPTGTAPSAAPFGQVATGQVVSVIGAKGGVGQTWLAVNLAAALASQAGMECLLADLDLASADVAVHLDLLGAPTIVDLVQQADEEGWPWSSLHQLRSCPLRILTGPERPQMASLLTPAAVRETIDDLSDRFAYTVCDHAPGDTDPLYLAVSERAAMIVLVTTLDAPALRQAKLRLEHLHQRGLGERTHVAINQFGPGGVLPHDGAAYLEHAAFTVVPGNRKHVDESIHVGRPLALQPGSEAGRAVHKLAAVLTGQSLDHGTAEAPWRRWLEQIWRR